MEIKESNEKVHRLFHKQFEFIITKNSSYKFLCSLGSDGCLPNRDYIEKTIRQCDPLTSNKHRIFKYHIWQRGKEDRHYVPRIGRCWNYLYVCVYEITRFSGEDVFINNIKTKPSGGFPTPDLSHLVGNEYNEDEDDEYYE